MNTKICCRCGLEKEISEFTTWKGKPKNPCKKCNKEYLKEYYYKNKEKAIKHNKDYYLQNKERLLSLNKEYRLKNKDKIKEQRKIYRKENENILKEKKKIYYENNKEKILNRMEKYYIDNKKEIIEKNIEYYKKNKKKLMNKANIRNAKRKKEDHIYRLKCQIRSMLKDCFRRKKETKNQHSEVILGCDINFFQKYLLDTYKKNYGIEWDGIEKAHIDHIIPLANANTEEEIIKLCHYSNLQLLKAKDNLEKGSNIEWELKNDNTN